MNAEVNMRSYHGETNAFLPDSPERNIGRESDMWPSPPASPINTARGAVDMNTEDQEEDFYDREGVRIPRKPAPQPPPDHAPFESTQGTSDLEFNGQAISLPQMGGFVRQYSADNILQESSVAARSTSNYMPAFATTGRLSKLNQGGSRELLTSNANSLSQNPIMFPNSGGITGRKSIEDLLEEEADEENDKAYCSHSVSKIFSVFYFVILFCVGSNVFYWHLWKPHLIESYYVKFFCMVVHLVALISLVFLFFSYRTAKQNDRFQRNKDERNCNNLLKLSIPVSGFMIVLGCTVRLLPNLINIFTECYLESILSVADWFLLSLFYFLLIYFLTLYSKVQVKPPKFLPQVAIFHVLLGCVSLLALESVSDVQIRLQSKENYSNETTWPLNTGHVSIKLSYLKNCSSNLLTRSFIIIDEYLYPVFYIFIVHFGFIASAFLSVMWCNIRPKTRARQQSVPSYITYGFGQKSKIFTCRHTSVGLLCGCVNLSATLAIVMYTVGFFTDVQKGNVALFATHNIYSLVVLVTLSLYMSRSWHSIRKHESKCWSHSKVDKPLLVISLLFVVLVDLGAIYAVSGRRYLELEPSSVSKFEFVLTVLVSACNTLQSIAQVVFIFDALCRVPNRQKTSSKGSVLAMALLNVSLWILDITQFVSLCPYKDAQMQSTWIAPLDVQPSRVNFFFSMEQHSQSFLWTFAMFVSNAFAIFFRFMSASSLLNVCQYSYD